MLNIVADRVEPTGAEFQRGLDNEPQGLIEAIEFIKRSRMYMMLGAVSGLLIGLTYLFIATPLYEGSVALIITDLRKAPAVTSQSILGGDAITDNAMMESQIEVLQSQRVAMRVLDGLNLASDPEFADRSILRRLFKTNTGIDEGDEKQRRTSVALEKFQSRLEVTRVGASYVLHINFLSESPQRASQIAKAVAQAYIAEVIEAKERTTEIGSKWLESRVEALREKAFAAEKAVAEYEAQNNITQTNIGTFDEQKIGNLVNELEVLRGKTAEAQAKLKRVEAVLRSSETGDISAFGDISDALKDEVIVKLRQQYFIDVRRVAELAAKYGENHRTVFDLRAEMQVIVRSMREELKHIAQTYKSDYDIAENNELYISQSLAQAIHESSETNFKRVKLRELQSTAETYKSLYANFLEHFMDASQQQNYPVTEAHIFSEPPPPMYPSKPKRLLTLALSIFAGLASGITYFFVKEQLHVGFRTADQLERQLRVASLGLLPKLAQKKLSDITEAYKNETPQMEQIPSLGRGCPISRFSVDHPFTRFAETINEAKLSIGRRGLIDGPQLVGIISTLPGEGKSTVSSNLAFSLASTGEPTLLLDLDLRTSKLTRALSPTAERGILSVLSSDMKFNEAILIDRETNLQFLPSVIQGEAVRTSEILSSRALDELLSFAKKNYEYVIIDLPPLAACIDAKTISNILDRYLLVVEWGATPRKIIASTFKPDDQITSKLCGFIMNKVDVSTYRAYTSLPEAFHEYYGGREK
jgi:polysaccharide biosynthesis transport protein